MALAATGDKTYAKKFRELIHFAADGEFSVNRDFINYHTHGLNQPFKKRFVETFGPRRGKGEPIGGRHRDLAYALQHTVEETALHVVRALAKKHKSHNLCLTGGVALNCVANARLLGETDYHSLWVPPCASDSGAPLGSACGTTIIRSGSRANFSSRTPSMVLAMATRKSRELCAPPTWRISG